MNVLVIVFAIIAGLGVGYLLAFSGRKADQVRLNILQRDFDALRQGEQQLREEHIVSLREVERLRENLRLTEERLASP
ncbi:MAG: hypothetical protein K2L23_09585 [Odoribacter sp.]|nr:hypothetical protein [Odoribacter sp.]